VWSIRVDVHTDASRSVEEGDYAGNLWQQAVAAKVAEIAVVVVVAEVAEVQVEGDIQGCSLRRVIQGQMIIRCTGPLEDGSFVGTVAAAALYSRGQIFRGTMSWRTVTKHVTRIGSAPHLTVYLNDLLHLHLHLNSYPFHIYSLFFAHLLILSTYLFTPNPLLSASPLI
jgi:hypothetical protein